MAGKDYAGMTGEQRKALSELRKLGYAICVWNPLEVGLDKPEHVEHHGKLGGDNYLKGVTNNVD